VGRRDATCRVSTRLRDWRGHDDVVGFVPFGHDVGGIEDGNDERPPGVPLDGGAELLPPGLPRLSATDNNLLQEEIFFIQGLVFGEKELERGWCGGCSARIEDRNGAVQLAL